MLYLLTALGTANGEGFSFGITTIPSLYYREVLKGNFVGEAVSFWNNATTQTFTVTTVPPGATVAKALLFWGCECNSSSDLMNITFNGNPITGTVVATTSTLCWGTSSYINYVADVTPYVSGNGSYTIQVPRALSSTPGADGATLYIIYCDPAETTRTITIYAGAHFLNSSSANWSHTGFTATSSPRAKASLTVGDPQDGYYNPGYFNGNYIGSFDGSVPGNHYGYWEGDVSSWVPSSATSVSWQLSSGGADCISPNVSVLAVTSTDTETFDCSAGYDDPVLIDEVGRVIARGNYTVYDASGRIVYSGSGEYRLGKGIYFIVAEGRVKRIVRR